MTGPGGWDRGRWLHAAILLAVLVAPLSALGHAVGSGWAPHGDDATIALRTWDVLSGRPPLTGMRSTSGDTGHPELASHHLGPLEFYLLAMPVALTGGSPVGLALGCTLIAGTASVLAVVWARRLGGELGMVIFGAGLLLTQWSIGLEALYRPFNPFPALLPVYLALLLSWAVLRGDHRALPPFAVVGALILQANLAFVPFAAALALLVAGAAVMHERRNPRRRPTREARSSYRWAGGLTVLAWLPSLLETLVHSPNNVVQVTRWALAGEGDSIGAGGALQHLGLLAPFPGGFRTLSVDLLLGGGRLAPFVGAALLAVLAIVATGWRTPNARASSSWPARVALVANLAMLATASRLPEWPSAPYWVAHWLPVVAFSWAALVWRACAYVDEATPTLPGRWVLPTAATVVASAVVLAAAAPRPDTAMDQSMTQAARTAAEALGPGEGRHVRIHGVGFTPLLSAAPAVSYGLRRQGWQPHHMTRWPFEEDAEHLWQATAPEDAEHVLITDSGQPELAQDVPEGAVVIGTVDVPHRDGELTLYRVPGG